MKIWKYIIVKILKYKNIHIRKSTIRHVEYCRCEKCERVCKEIKYIHKKAIK